MEMEQIDQSGLPFRCKLHEVARIKRAIRKKSKPSRYRQRMMIQCHEARSLGEGRRKWNYPKAGLRFVRRMFRPETPKSILWPRIGRPGES